MKAETSYLILAENMGMKELKLFLSLHVCMSSNDHERTANIDLGVTNFSEYVNSQIWNLWL